MATDITKIRNVGLAGHGGVGKTSLVESILFAAGAVGFNGVSEAEDIQGEIVFHRQQQPTQPRRHCPR